MAHELQVLVLGCVVQGGVASVVSGVDLLGGEFCVEGSEGCEGVLGSEGEEFVDVDDGFGF